MLKFIEAYTKKPTDMNALKLAHYAKLHPDEIRLLTNPQADVLTKARAQLAPFVAKINAVIIGEFI